jgi:hypothetical protein
MKHLCSAICLVWCGAFPLVPCPLLLFPPESSLSIICSGQHHQYLSMHITSRVSIVNNLSLLGDVLVVCGVGLSLCPFCVCVTFAPVYIIVNRHQYRNNTTHQRCASHCSKSFGQASGRGVSLVSLMIRMSANLFEHPSIQTTSHQYHTHIIGSASRVPYSIRVS